MCRCCAFWIVQQEVKQSVFGGRKSIKELFKTIHRNNQRTSWRDYYGKRKKPNVQNCQEYFETINLGEICSSCASKNTSHVLPKSKTLSRMAYLRKILVEAAFVLLAHILLSLINVKIEPYVLNSFNPVSGQAVQAIRSTSLLVVIAIPTILLMIRFMLVFLGATASRIRDVGYSGVYASLILMPLLPVVIGIFIAHSCWRLIQH